MTSKIARATGICWIQSVIEPSFLIDTNCCIYLFSQDYPELLRRVAVAPVGSIALSAIAFTELAHGSERGLVPDPVALEKLVRQMPVLPFDRAAAAAYAKLPFERGNFDRFIAAHAIALKLKIITRNVSDFEAIPGVCAEDWTQ